MKCKSRVVSIFRLDSMQHVAWLLLALTMLMLVLSIGGADFNTKGEPREVVVAHSMLTQGNWILPVDNAGDISYKPPMFHWLVAISCTLFGTVNEFASRFPSALALAILTTITYLFFCKRGDSESDVNNALLTALLTFTSFECYRAGTNCRVDMVLTAFMCGAMMCLYKGLITRKLWFYGIAVVCMSGATLTKGPVGIMMPLAVYWIFSLMRGRNFFAISGISLILMIVSALLPAWYYYEAWRIGGDSFYNLAMEENFGRLTGSMSYDSHVKPWWYNLLSLLTGWLPWSLFVLVSAVWVWSHRVRSSSGLKADRDHCKVGLFRKLRSLSDEQLFALIGAA